MAGRPRITKMINVPKNGKIPEKEIDLNQVIYWAEMQATQEEVAGSFRVCVETLNRHLVEAVGMTYKELLTRVNGNAKLSLRRYQFEQAKKNATMAIWLGKIWLGQMDPDKKGDYQINEKGLADFEKLMALMANIQGSSNAKSSETITDALDNSANDTTA